MIDGKVDSERLHEGGVSPKSIGLVVLVSVPMELSMINFVSTYFYIVALASVSAQI